MMIEICITRLAQVTKPLNWKNMSLITSAVEFVNAGFHHVQSFAFGFVPRSRWPLSSTIDYFSNALELKKGGGLRRAFYYANPPHSVCKNSATTESDANNECYTEEVSSIILTSDARNSPPYRSIIQIVQTILFPLIIRIVSIHTIFRRILPRHVNSEWRQSSNSSELGGRCSIY